MFNLTNSKAGKATPAPQLTPDSPAFPFVVDIPHPMDPKTVTRQVFVGVTVRDYFAAHALATCTDSYCAGEPDTATGVAEWAYRIADAMLKVRANTPNVVGVSPDGNGLNDSQFHGDHLKPNL